MRTGIKIIIGFGVVWMVAFLVGAAYAFYVHANTDPEPTPTVTVTVTYDPLQPFKDCASYGAAHPEVKTGCE